MDLDTLMVGTFCQIDDALKACLVGSRLRERGPSPLLADSEVLIIKAVRE
jgi:hypothetical protein